jgi:hypothetical protein
MCIGGRGNPFVLPVTLLVRVCESYSILERRRGLLGISSFGVVESETSVIYAALAAGIMCIGGRGNPFVLPEVTFLVRVCESFSILERRRGLLGIPSFVVVEATSPQRFAVLGFELLLKQMLIRFFPKLMGSDVPITMPMNPAFGLSFLL